MYMPCSWQLAETYNMGRNWPSSFTEKGALELGHTCMDNRESEGSTYKARGFYQK